MVYSDDGRPAVHPRREGGGVNLWQQGRWAAVVWSTRVSASRGGRMHPGASSPLSLAGPELSENLGKLSEPACLKHSFED